MKMKHVFILNPAAGKGNAVNLMREIVEAGNELNIDFEIYETQEMLDAEVAAKKYASMASEEYPVRIYACGGDGTVNEVLNGIIDEDNVELAVLPMGTGNDFIRSFGSKGQFMDIRKQMLSKSRKVDVLRYKYSKEDYFYEKYIMNMLNIGFDCRAADAMQKYKTKPFVSGTMAYILGVAENLVKMEGESLKITLDNGEVFEKNVLLVCIANGRFYGGGFKSAPYAEVDDGLIDVSIVERCTRKQLISIIGKYNKGTHLDTKLGKKIVTYRKCKSLTIETTGNDMAFAADGEPSAADTINIEIVPKAINFVDPVIEEEME
ncbi:MAG: diacylglycerol kinase family protein [Eubacterium sp.]|nr:diacylglycerol kinase family protein [Eubacterium sp.]